MTVYLVLAFTLFIGFSFLAILIILMSLLPKKEKKKRPFSLIDSTWDKLKKDNVYLSKWLLGIALLLFLSLSVFTKQSRQDFIDGIVVEMFGVLFDVTVLVLLFNWFNDKGEREKRVQSYRDEIDDFRYWKSEEAKYRIKGSIVRLNKEGETALNLGFIDLSNLDFRDYRHLGRHAKTVDLTEAKLLQTDFSNCKLPSAIFKDTQCISTRFVGKDTVLMRCDFTNAHLQSADFREACIHGADFSSATFSRVNLEDADLRHAKFRNARFYDTSMLGAWVDKDFLTRLKRANIKGQLIYKLYDVEEIPSKINPNVFEYMLIPKQPEEPKLSDYTQIIDF